MPIGILVLATALVLVPVRGIASGIEIEFLTDELPWAVTEKVYSPQPLETRVSGACPMGGVGYTVIVGELPPGIQLSRLGYFSGTPGHSGTFRFVVRAANGCSTVKKAFTIVVTGTPLMTVTPTHLDFKWKLGETSPEQMLHVSATWPALGYEIIIKDADGKKDGDWLKATPEHGFTPREASALTEDLVHVRVDGSELKPGHYSATLFVSAWQAVAGTGVIVELTVTGK